MDILAFPSHGTATSNEVGITHRSEPLRFTVRRIGPPMNESLTGSFIRCAHPTVAVVRELIARMAPAFGATATTW